MGSYSKLTGIGTVLVESQADHTSLKVGMKMWGKHEISGGRIVGINDKGDRQNTDDAGGLGCLSQLELTFESN